MHISALSLATVLLGAASAWELTLFQNAVECEVMPNTVYRVLSGTENDRCYNFIESHLPYATDAGYLPCTQYESGGDRHGPCTPDGYNPASVLMRAEGPAKCTVYVDADCTGYHDDGVPYDVTCGARHATNWGYGAYQSFKCKW